MLTLSVIWCNAEPALKPCRDNFKIHVHTHAFNKFMAWQYSQSIPRDVDNESRDILLYKVGLWWKRLERQTQSLTFRWDTCGIIYLITFHLFGEVFRNEGISLCSQSCAWKIQWWEKVRNSCYLIRGAGTVQPGAVQFFWVSSQPARGDDFPPLTLPHMSHTKVLLGGKAANLCHLISEEGTLLAVAVQFLLLQLSWWDTLKKERKKSLA